jgi:hypothetical protein
MHLAKDRYSDHEYMVRVSLRSRPGRNVATFRIETYAFGREWDVVFLDRATTPIQDRVLQEWATAVDQYVTRAVETRYGVQPQLYVLDAQSGSPASRPGEEVPYTT